MISVVVATLNEATALPDTLARLAAETTAYEVVVADGGSDDGTPAIARAHGARVVAAARGRGRQLAAGAAAARGTVLLFLHADTRLPPGGLGRIAEALGRDPACPGGNFRILFDGSRRFDRWLEGFYAWIRRNGFYYGDSAIFIRREVYDAIGGIRPIDLMEDYDLARRLERQGGTACLEPPVVTSSRKFSRRGAPGIVAGWLAIHAAWHLGVPPSRLARWYYGRRRRGALPASPASQGASATSFRRQSY